MIEMKKSQWCTKHWKPYAAGEGNAMVASVLLFQKLVHEDRFIERCHGDTNRMNSEVAKIVEQYGGVCCYLGEEVMNEIYRQTGILLA